MQCDSCGGPMRAGTCTVCGYSDDPARIEMVPGVIDTLDQLDEVLREANMVHDEDDIYERRYDK